MLSGKLNEVIVTGLLHHNDALQWRADHPEQVEQLRYIAAQLEAGERNEELQQMVNNIVTSIWENNGDWATKQLLYFPVELYFKHGIVADSGSYLDANFNWRQLADYFQRSEQANSYRPHRWDFGDSGATDGDEATGLEGLPSEQSDQEKTINAWIEGLEGSPVLQEDKDYELCFRVGDPVKDNLFSGQETAIDLAEIPDEGLLTEWVVTAADPVLLGQYSALDPVKVLPVAGAAGLAVKFGLLIPREGDSEKVRLSLKPQQKGRILLNVLVYTCATGGRELRELYRQFEIPLQVEDTSREHDTANLVQNQVVYSPASQQHIRTMHEWTTPPGELNITVVSPTQAMISGDAGNDTVEELVSWHDASPTIAGPLANMITSAEKFRATWYKALNDLPDVDFMDRLNRREHQYNWDNFQFRVDDAHEATWKQMASSSELLDLAYDAHIVYQVFFPSGSRIREIMDALTPGQKIKISWMAAVDAGFAPHVPWAMMYTQPPAANEVDGSLFMGLRYRIGYTSSKIYASKALGKLDKAFSANLFYWDDQPGDPVHDEVLWQQQQFGALLDNRVNVPEAGDASPKQALVSMLNQPGVTPLAVMYLYCHCSVGDGNTPVLRFGAKPSPDYTISRRELGGSAFADKPLVFANACTTAVADPYMANELAATFFRRDCRAYIGTEIKMPIVFASRFAFLFFNFFYRKIDPDPIAGGEAVAQSRVWLWTNYRNIGGLFYSYVNQYDLYMADEEEVKGMRRR